MLDFNPILDTDSYKASHWLQMPPGSEFQSSYIESRGGKWNETLFFGLQMFIKKYLLKPITVEMVDEAERFFTAHGEPFNRGGWMYIVNQHDGFLPLKIQAVDEGTIVPIRNVLVQVVNTDRNVPWLTSYIETALLRAIWYPTTVATNSMMIKRVIYNALQKTADDPDSEIEFKLHDFGARGVSSFESAGIGGAAHLVNFMGTDTISGAIQAIRYYNISMPGFSIPASEHSTITSWGGLDKEWKAFDNMLDQFAKPGTIVACVSDSYDIYRACTELWGSKLKQKVLDSGATLVVRPDSGDPLVVPIEVIEILMDKFGYTENSKGFKVLPDAIRVIQGDGINLESITKICKNMHSHMLSLSNLNFGMGGALLQQIDRDTQQFAMKCSALKIGGFWREVYKNPVGDVSKASKKGRLALVKVNGVGPDRLITIAAERVQKGDNQLKDVYLNGKLIRNHSFQEIRERVAAGFTPAAELDDEIYGVDQ